MIAFGPVPSRRLGRSLGINTIPAKHCSYSCLYCQVGPTQDTETARRSFYTPTEVFEAVREHVLALRARGETIDYLTIVPDGEPTLDGNLGQTLTALRALDIPLAVISNASLITHPDVRRELALADWVSLKLDSVIEPVWRRLNRPDAQLQLAEILVGMGLFAREFNGFLATETMLLDGINTADTHIDALSVFLTRLQPDRAYLAVPTRPMADRHSRIPAPETLNRVFQRVSERFDRVELLTGYEGDAMASTGDFVHDVLAIAAVHPLRESQVMALLDKTRADRRLVDTLLRDGRLRAVEYNGRRFFIRAYDHAAGDSR